LLGYAAFFFLQLLCLSIEEQSNVIIRGDTEMSVGKFRLNYLQQELT